MIEVASDVFGPTTNRTALSQRVRQWAQQHLKGKEVRNIATAHRMLISMNGVRHTLKTWRRAETVASIAVLPKLAEQAQLVESRNPGPRAGRNVVAVNVYEVPFRVDGNLVVAKLFFKRVHVDKEDVEQLDVLEVYYHHKTVPNKNPDASTVGGD